MTKTCLPVILASAVMLLPALAEDWTTTDGVVHKDVQIVKIAPDSVTITDSDGGATIPFYALSPDIQKRFIATTPTKFDPMKVVASWTSITTAVGNVIPITKVTAVDSTSIHYETENGIGHVLISDLPSDVQKSLEYDSAAAQKAFAAEQAREAATDAMIAQVTANDQAASQQAEKEADFKKEMLKNSIPLVAKVTQVLPDGILAEKMEAHYNPPIADSMASVGGGGGVASGGMYYEESGTTIFIEMPASGLTEGQQLTVKGARNGTYTFTDTNGASRTVEKWVKVDNG